MLVRRGPQAAAAAERHATHRRHRAAPIASRRSRLDAWMLGAGACTPSAERRVVEPRTRERHAYADASPLHTGAERLRHSRSGGRGRRLQVQTAGRGQAEHRSGCRCAVRRCRGSSSRPPQPEHAEASTAIAHRLRSCILHIACRRRTPSLRHAAAAAAAVVAAAPAQKCQQQRCTLRGDARKRPCCAASSRSTSCSWRGLPKSTRCCCCALHSDCARMPSRAPRKAPSASLPLHALSRAMQHSLLRAGAASRGLRRGASASDSAADSGRARAVGRRACNVVEPLRRSHAVCRCTRFSAPGRPLQA